jgi:copper chaperone
MSNTEHTYNVEGMSCQHCVSAVTAEVGELQGVSSVEIDLDSGAVLVRGSNVDGDAIKAAVEQAGYSLAA